ncbi:branched-chain amino acid ABC transporter permease [Actimicrobium sp. CCC2.4]|uniref:branched-chain amino acid ABC transporter permease n=1 Tax=Actimicrobium sp. CCC2.4 TaxID=3048606 RepID=UPI002AC8A8DB|nr:branched-chain amino acid ABC transporter permease [Actimicrobium sp. CCC2.4]MEB0133960.1 branched-chain amino acid ABC transporter permease [Actimicrobium sp. CCC2.4]WPX31498.1 branched-chain amino acid ABC transporter permease [Actimicrobium sp. CCC2.4]
MRIGSAKQSYLADQALFDSTPQRAWFGVLLLALVAFPFMANEYWLYLACLVGLNIVSTTGLNLLTGYTGLVSLGQAAFMGLGAYTVAILQVRYGSPFLLNLLAGGIVAMLGGILVGLPSLRVKGLYLAIATIAAGFMTHFLFAHWAGITGGNGGMTVPPARLFGAELDTSFRLYWVIAPIMILMVFGAANLFRTRIGRAFIAIRDRDISAAVLGIPLMPYKLMSFAISSFYAGVAGGLFAYFFRVVTPESFPLLMSIFFLAAVIVGGMGTISGSIFGAIFMTLVPELLKLIVGWLPLGDNATLVLSPVRTIVFGSMIVLFLIFEPHGLAEIWRRIRRLFHLWPFRT